MEAGSGVNTIITFIGDMDNPSDANLHFNNFGFHLNSNSLSLFVRVVRHFFDAGETCIIQNRFSLKTL